MSVNSIFGVASSGLDLQARRLEVSASNVANVSTDGFKASQVAAQEQASGGVTSQIVPTGDAPAMMLRGGAMVQGSNTDLVTELVTQRTALHAYQANLNVLRTNDELLGAVLNIKT